MQAATRLRVCSSRGSTSRMRTARRAVGDPPTRIHSCICFASERSIASAWSCSLVGCHRKPAPWGHSFSVFLLFCLKSQRQRPLLGGPPWEPAPRTPGAAHVAPFAASEERRSRFRGAWTARFYQAPALCRGSGLTEHQPHLF